MADSRSSVTQLEVTSAGVRWLTVALSCLGLSFLTCRVAPVISRALSSSAVLASHCARTDSPHNAWFSRDRVLDALWGPCHLVDLPRQYFCHLVPSSGLLGLALNTGPGHWSLSHLFPPAFGGQLVLHRDGGKGQRLGGGDVLGVWLLEIKSSTKEGAELELGPGCHLPEEGALGWREGTGPPLISCILSCRCGQEQFTVTFCRQHFLR